jgi:hypothetical protein
MLRCFPKKNRRSRGNTMVEGSLALTLFAFSFLGVVDLGQVMTLHQGLAERARAGARWAVVNPYDNDGIENVVVYGTPTPDASSRAMFYLNRNVVSTELLDQNTPEARVVVRIEGYQFNFFSPLIGRRYTAKPIVVSMPVEEAY